MRGSRIYLRSAMLHEWRSRMTKPEKRIGEVSRPLGEGDGVIEGVREVGLPYVLEPSSMELMLLASLVRGEVDRLRPFTVKRGLSPAMKEMAIDEHGRAVALLAKLEL